MTSPEFSSSLKVSLHMSGACHLAFVSEDAHDRASTGWDGEIGLQAMPRELAAGSRERDGRFHRAWTAAEPSPGIRMPLHIAVPSDGLSVMSLSRISARDVLWVDSGPPGTVVIISFAFTSEALPSGEWPGSRSPGTTMVKSFSFASGRTIWVLGLIRTLTPRDKAWLNACARVPVDPERAVSAEGLDKEIPRVILPCVENGAMALWDVDRGR